jgi:hypothetical protein
MVTLLFAAFASGVDGGFVILTAQRPSAAGAGAGRGSEDPDANYDAIQTAIDCGSQRADRSPAIPRLTPPTKSRQTTITPTIMLLGRPMTENAPPGRLLTTLPRGSPASGMDLQT